MQKLDKVAKQISTGCHWVLYHYLEVELFITVLIHPYGSPGLWTGGNLCQRSDPVDPDTLSPVKSMKFPSED